MPRKKEAPQRKDDEAQRGAAWRMGEATQDSAENLEVNQALTTSAAAASSSQETPFPTPLEESTEREYTVTFDDNEEEEGIVISDDEEEGIVISEDEYLDHLSFTQRQTTKGPSTGKRRRKPEPRIVDQELDAHIADSHILANIVKTVPGEGTKWTCPIGKTSIQLDADKHDLSSLVLPEQPQCWIYVSGIPGRSILYYEWFEKKKGETPERFAKRQKKGNPDHVEYFHINDPKDTHALEAFGIKQKMVFLKFHKYYNFSGVMELKICITEDSLVVLNHPSDSRVSVPAEVKRTLNFCFDVPSPIFEATNEETVLDVDQMYAKVKVHHDQGNAGRQVRVQVNPQHRSLLPKLRKYQAEAVRWMLEQERYHCNLDPDLEEEPPTLHPLYQEVRTQDGTQLFFSSAAGYLTKEAPKGVLSPPGGILADEMGLGKTVEVLACMLCNPRPDVPAPEYLEPIKLKNEKKKKRRRRSPSPVEFHLQDDGQQDSDKQEESTNIAQVDGGDDSGSDSSPDFDPENQDLQEKYNYNHGPGGSGRKNNQREPSETEEGSAEDDAVDNMSLLQRAGARGTKRKKESALKKAFTAKRTIYHHSDFDSEESEDEYIPKPKKRKSPSKKKEPTGSKKSESKAKVINTEKVHDDSHPTYSPFRNGAFMESSTHLYDLVIKAVHSLSKGSNAKQGLSMTKIKEYISKHFEKQYAHKSFAKKFSESITKGEACGQFIKTSNTKGASGSIVLNPHYNPDDTRGFYSFRELTPEEATIEEIITQYCYDNTPFEMPHIPKVYENIREKKAKTSGELYKKMNAMYEMALPMSLAFYASDKRSKKWNSEFFDTKVEQRSYFECICGGSEEESRKARHRVRCGECGTEQHSECVKYDVTDPYRGEYFCPHCWVARAKVKSGATLIVSPSSISFQWIEEIQKHVKHKDIKMLFYKGSKESGYMQPRTLANYDIVVTTYETLAAETNYVDLPHSNSSEGRRFRNPKRYMAMPSPIVCIEWWRICLDEAQMIESTTTKTAEMAMKLSAVNRWCVTGTPVGKSINDLHGLLVFLQIDPYWAERWWRLCIFEPFCKGLSKPLLDLLCKVLWRTCKRDVLDQIDIPDQREETHWLGFSPVEEHYYRQQHIEVSSSMITSLRRYDGSTKLSEMDKKTLSTLLLPILKLRQACCHPQAVRGQFISLQKTTMTMEGLLDQLISKAILECEESHRVYVSALNGLAGIDIIQEKWAEAAENYREVMRSVAEHEGKLKTDTLQRLHTVSNLAELIEASHEGIAPTMRDSELRVEAKKLKEKYMTKYYGGVNGAREALEPATKGVNECYDGFVNETSWYQDVIDFVEAADLENQILKLVHEELAQFYDVVNEKEFKEIQQKYPSSRMVLYKIYEKLEDLEKKREVVMNDMKELAESNPEQFLNDAVDCHLRISTASRKNKNKCRLCEVHDNIEIYENTLFHFVKGEIKGSKGPNRASVTAEERKKLEDAGVFMYDEQRRGTWSDSEVERLLRATLKFAKNRQGGFKGPLVEDGNNQVRLFEGLKKEFRLTRIYWRQFYDNVNGVDELNMCTLRLRLKYEDEQHTPTNWFTSTAKRKAGETDFSTRLKDKVETIYILENHEVDSQKLRLIGDKCTSLGDLKRKLGQLSYLESLKTTDYGKKVVSFVLSALLNTCFQFSGWSQPRKVPDLYLRVGQQLGSVAGKNLEFLFFNFSMFLPQCGHCYCVDCIQILIKEYSQGKGTKCAVCRSLYCTLHNFNLTTTGTRHPTRRSPMSAQSRRRRTTWRWRKFVGVTQPRSRL